MKIGTAFCLMYVLHVYNEKFWIWCVTSETNISVTAAWIYIFTYNFQIAINFIIFFLNVCTTYHTFSVFLSSFAFCMHARIIRKNVFSFSVCFCCYAYKLLSYIYLKFNFLTNYCIQGYFRPVLFSPFYTWNKGSPCL